MNFFGTMMVTVGIDGNFLLNALCRLAFVLLSYFRRFFPQQFDVASPRRRRAEEMPAAVQILSAYDGSPIYVRVYRGSLTAQQVAPWRKHAFEQVTLFPTLRVLFDFGKFV